MDRRTTDKVIPMCRYASQATQKSCALVILEQFNKIFLPPWTELSWKYLGKDKSVFRGVVQDSIYDVTA